MTVYNNLVKVLPRNLENIKNVEIKFTMSKPQKIKVRWNQNVKNRFQNTR